MKSVIIERFNSQYQAEDFANAKSKEGYRMVNMAIHFSQFVTVFAICMELAKFERVGGQNV